MDLPWRIWYSDRLVGTVHESFIARPLGLVFQISIQLLAIEFLGNGLKIIFIGCVGTVPPAGEWPDGDIDSVKHHVECTLLGLYAAQRE